MKQSKGDKSLSSPLALLEELSHSLIAHLEQACGEALLNGEKQLGKLDREQEKLQARIDKRLVKLEAAITAGGKARSRSKLTTEIAEMEKLLADLQQDRGALLAYIEQLRGEIARTLELGIGISEVGLAAAAAQAPVKARKDKAPKLPDPVPATVEDSVAAAPVVEVAARPVPASRPAAAKGTQGAPRRRRGATRPAAAEVAAEPKAETAKPAQPRRRRGPRPAGATDKPADSRRRTPPVKPDQE